MFTSIPPITRNIILINIAMFILTYFLPSLQDLFAGYYPFSPNFKSFQILTHLFMHGGFMHILFNMFTLWSFGPILEQSLGGRKYLILYFVSGIGAFLLYNVYNYFPIHQLQIQLQSLGIDPATVYQKATIGYEGDLSIGSDSPSVIEASQELFGYFRTPMVGASGAIFGVIAAFATLYPDSKIGIMFIPIPVKVKYVLPVIIIGSVYLGFYDKTSNVAHLAHVGGALVGFILALFWKRNRHRFY